MADPMIQPIAGTDLRTVTDEERAAIRAFLAMAELAGAKLTASCVDVYHCGLFLTGAAAEELRICDLPCLAVAAFRDEQDGDAGRLSWCGLVRTTEGRSLLVLRGTHEVVSFETL